MTGAAAHHDADADEGREGGMGRCKRFAAMRSPGDSNATAGRPNVDPSNDASAPPKEWPTSQTLELGYIAVTLLTISYSCSSQYDLDLERDTTIVTYYADEVEKAVLYEGVG